MQAAIIFVSRSVVCVDGFTKADLPYFLQCQCWDLTALFSLCNQGQLDWLPCCFYIQRANCKDVSTPDHLWAPFDCANENRCRQSSSPLSWPCGMTRLLWQPSGWPDVICCCSGCSSLLMHWCRLLTRTTTCIVCLWTVVPQQERDSGTCGGSAAC
jgi:hypothetical protein